MRKKREKKSSTKLLDFNKLTLFPNSCVTYFSASQGKHCDSLSEIQSKIRNKSAKYVLFVCPNPQNGNLTQVGSRSCLGSWELLGIFKGLFVFTLENQALASAPLNPPLKTQRQRKGMLNVNGQTPPAPLERERDEGTRPDLVVFSYTALRGQKWNCTHTAKGVHHHKLQKIITA